MSFLGAPFLALPLHSAYGKCNITKFPPPSLRPPPSALRNAYALFVFALAVFVSLCRNLHADPVLSASVRCPASPIPAPRPTRWQQLCSEGFSLYPSKFGLSGPRLRPPLLLPSSFLLPPARYTYKQGLLSPRLLPPSLASFERVFIMRAHDRFEHVLLKLLRVLPRPLSAVLSLSHVQV